MMVKVKNGAATFSFTPKELRILANGVMVASSSLVQAERETDKMLLETMGAAFQAALEACRLQFELPPACAKRQNRV